jgi:DNA-binding CsgD family transcriptional regulator
LSQEKKTQIAACHGKGMTVKEIAKKAKLTEAQVDVFLQSIGKKPLYRRNTQKSKEEKRSYNRLTEEQKDKILELSKDGLNMYEIAEKLDIKSATVYKFLHKVKEKEPESAATDTSSVGCIKKTDGDTVSLSKDTTIEAKCQVLAKALKFAHKGILTQYEEMSHECQLAFDLGQLFAEIEQRMKEGGIEVE